ncbi:MULTISPECIES: hypothetical protein [unclassified Synechococcus]|uniref:hypothetical protein n=1 Tax=unclassified Synechococcus TaxID=2626047 RepID=UPI001FDFCA9E|nr:hypothetical protein [Synechococcus sp. WH 8020]
MLFAGLASLHGVQKPFFKRCEFWVGFTNGIVSALLGVVDEFIALVEAHVILALPAT